MLNIYIGKCNKYIERINDAWFGLHRRPFTSIEIALLENIYIM